MDTTDKVLTTANYDVLRAVENEPQLLFDLALVLEGKAEDILIDDVLARYNLPHDALSVIEGIPATATRLKALRTDIRDNGLSFKRKAQAFAEAALPVVAAMVHDEDVPPATRVTAASRLVEWGDLAPKTAADGASGVIVHINFPEGAKPFKVIEGEVIDGE